MFVLSWQSEETLIFLVLQSKSEETLIFLVLQSKSEETLIFFVLQSKSDETICFKHCRPQSGVWRAMSAHMLHWLHYGEP